MNRRGFLRSIGIGLLTGAALAYAPRLLRKPAVQTFTCTTGQFEVRVRVDASKAGGLIEYEIWFDGRVLERGPGEDRVERLRARME